MNPVHVVRGDVFGVLVMSESLNSPLGQQRPEAADREIQRHLAIKASSIPADTLSTGGYERAAALAAIRNELANQARALRLMPDDPERHAAHEALLIEVRGFAAICLGGFA